MRDTDDRIVSASLHAMAHLVPFLGGPAVTGLIHVKSFSDGIPKVTTTSYRLLPILGAFMRIIEVAENEMIIKTTRLAEFGLTSFALRPCFFSLCSVELFVAVSLYTFIFTALRRIFIELEVFTIYKLLHRPR